MSLSLFLLVTTLFGFAFGTSPEVDDSMKNLFSIKDYDAESIKMKSYSLRGMKMEAQQQGNRKVVEMCRDHPSGKGTVALVFVHGPSNLTGELLTVLSEEKVKANFLVAASYVKTPLAVTNVVQILKNGHVLGLSVLKSFNGESKASEIIEQIEKDSDQLRREIPDEHEFVIKYVYISGQSTFSENVIKKISDAGYTIIGGIDSGDYIGTKKLLDQYEASIGALRYGNGHFIMRHMDAGAGRTAQEYRNVFKYIKNSKYKVITLDTCLGDDSANNDGGKKGTTPSGGKGGKGKKKPVDDSSSSSSSATITVSGFLVMLLSFATLLF